MSEYTENECIRETIRIQDAEIDRLRAKVEALKAEVPEGCTPADARVLRKANLTMAIENAELRAHVEALKSENEKLAAMCCIHPETLDAACDHDTIICGYDKLRAQVEALKKEIIYLNTKLKSKTLVEAALRGEGE